MSKRSEVFNLRRFGLTMWRDLRGRSSSALVGVGAGTGILIVFSLLNIWAGEGDTGFHRELFSFALTIGGLLFTSQVFRDLHRKETVGGYLLLPAAALEKVVTRILTAGIGWVLFILIWYSLLSMLSEGINLLIFGRTHSLFNPFSAAVWTTIAHYLVVHSLFLVGAIYFRKLHFLKTILVLFLAGVGFSILGFIGVRLMFWNFFQEAFLMANEETLGPVFESLSTDSEGVLHAFTWIARIVYWAVLPVLCWVVTYVRFREVEVHHGI